MMSLGDGGDASLCEELSEFSILKRCKMLEVRWTPSSARLST